MYSPTAPDGVKFEGAWTEMQCLSGGRVHQVVPARPSKNAKCDTFKSFKAMKDGTSEEERCRRCGFPNSEHEAAAQTDKARFDLEVQKVQEAQEVQKVQKYQVVVATVYVRKEPSTTAAPVGFVHEGSVLFGEVTDGWFKLSAHSCERLNFAPNQAYVATEGCFADRPDLGVLLEPLRDGEILESLETRVAEKPALRNTDSLRLRADRACQVLGKEPLLFQVVSEKACLRAEPSIHSPAKQTLKKGEIVKGFPSGSWLRLDGSQEGWVLIEAPGSDANLYLEAEWSKIGVKQAFLEALILEWPGLRIDQKVTYAVEWRQSGTSGAGGHAVSKSRKIHLTGLPTDGNFAMRVLACVTSSAQGVTPLRLNGPWVEATSLPADKRPGRARAGSLDVNLDPMGEVRGECQASKCSAYLAPEDSASYVNDPKSTLCRRCGHSFLEHKKGERDTKMRPAQASKTASAGKQALSSQKGVASFVVQHRAVLLRSKPSVKADKLGIVCRGHVLKGYEMEGWVQLTRESSQQAGAAGKIAWALINGEEVGLGVLLRPLKPGETPKAMEEDSDEEKGVSWRAEDIYTGALEFEVVFKSVSVRRRPRVTAKSVGIVKEGDRIFGYPKDNWLQTSKKYRQKDPGWIRMDGTDLGHGPLLQCTSLKPQMTKCFAEALLITWQQLPVKSALYTLEWMGQDKKTKAVALDKTRLTTGKIQGLAADSTYYVRVIALVMVPGIESSHPKSMCAQICSDWVEAQTGAPVDTVEQTSMTFDPLARIRGRCNS